MKLAEIGELYHEIERALEESQGEVTPEIEALREQFNLAEADKVDAYLWMMKDLRGRAKLAREQAAELAAKARTMDARAEWLQRGLEQHMAEQGLKELRGYVRYAKYQGNGGAEPIKTEREPEPDDVAMGLARAAYSWDIDALRDALADEGHPLHSRAKAAAYVGARGVSLRVY